MVTRLIRSSVLGVLLFSAVLLTLSAPSVAQIGIGISVHFGPPALPVYEQPICPGDGYIWTPGYWAWNADIDDYYWVPGTWVLAPQVGFLWTPPWWGWSGGAYIFHAGWWGPHIGFYGGINYGFGYFGVGFEGGYWQGGQFFYNRSVSNINVTNIHNVYNKTVINNTTINRVSYNGGEGGVTARPTPEEERAEHEQHVGPVAAQTQHQESARSDPQQRASVNHGKPAVAATAKPGEMHGRGVVGAKEAGAPYHPPERGNEARGNEARGNEARGNETRGNEAAGRPENKVPRPPNASHASELSPHEKLPAPNTGNAKQDQKFQQQQDKLAAQQEKEHQKLQQQQEKEHQQAAKRNADEASRQQMEQRHQQQTQAMEQRHAQQTQRMQERVQKASRPPSNKR